MVLELFDPGFGPKLCNVKIDGPRVMGDLLREPITRSDWVNHDYNVHFCFGLKNKGPADLSVEVSINKGEAPLLAHKTTSLFWKRAGQADFERADVPVKTDFRKQYAFTFSLRSGEDIVLANTIPRSLEKIISDADKIVREIGAGRRVYGRSVEGRDLVSYEFGDPTEQPTILITSGIHPPEPDTYATLEILRKLCVNDPLSQKFAVVVVPVANPDGYAVGSQGCNANGINFFWDFAWDKPDLCPEATALLQLADTVMPVGYIDFHCYTFQMLKKPGPYQRPLLFYTSEETRRAAQTLYRELRQDANAEAVTGLPAFAPSTLGAILAARYDTLALAKYHVHLAEGPDGIAFRGQAVFLSLCKALAAVPRRVGRRTPNPGFWTMIRRNSLQSWAAKWRPSLGLLRRVRLSEVNWSRRQTIQADPDWRWPGDQAKT